jgi:hypothetical protein
MRRRIEMQNGPMLAGAQRSRLLMLLMLLMLVAALMYRARDPRLWSMFGGDDRGAKLVETFNDPPATPSRTARKPQRLALAGLTQAAERESAEEESSAEVPPIADDTPPSQEPVDGGDGQAKPAAAPTPAAADDAPAEEPQPPEIPPPDEDSEERSALTEEMTAVADNTFLQPEEMFAYYRLLRWAMSQSIEQLHQKAIQDPRYGDIFERPAFYRGKLVEFQLRVRRVLPHKDLEKDNLAGVDQVWELFGYNDTSGQNFYMCITDKLPDKMTYGANVVEDGRFVGYFLKLMRYEDRQGKNRAIPVFIGKFIWDPPIRQGANPQEQMREVYWVLIAAAIFAAFMVGRWALKMMKPSGGRSSLHDNPSLQMLRRRRSMENDSEEENIDVESWLEQTENEADDSEIKPDANDDSEEDRR